MRQSLESQDPVLITLEAIKNHKISGRPALQWLQDQDKYVFHGTTAFIDHFGPRQAYNAGEPDGPPAVFATPYCDIAIFRSLIHKEYDKAQGRLHKSHFSAVVSEQGTTLSFGTLANELERVQQENRTGYVAVFAKEAFQPKVPGEVVSYTDVEAIAVVKTKFEDLPINIVQSLTLD